MYLSNDLQQAREPFKKNKATYVVCWLDLLTPVSDFSTQRKLDSVASALPLWAWLPGLLLPATVACAAHWGQIFCEITFIVFIGNLVVIVGNVYTFVYGVIWKYVIKVHSFLKLSVFSIFSWLNLVVHTFTKPFSWCRLRLAWKVWWNYHQIESTEDFLRMNAL